jgi:hypothetical protein
MCVISKGKNQHIMKHPEGWNVKVERKSKGAIHFGIV